jgi:hypothetical protein
MFSSVYRLVNQGYILKENYQQFFQYEHCFNDSIFFKNYTFFARRIAGTLYPYKCTCFLRFINGQNGALRAPRPAHHSFADPSGDINDIQ